MFLTNAFSLSMLPESVNPHVVEFAPLTIDKVRTILGDGFTSAIGHADTACILSEVLGIPVPMNRVSVKLPMGTPDWYHRTEVLAIVAQYNGPRLPEGTTTLPEGAEFRFYAVRLVYAQ